MATKTSAKGLSDKEIIRRIKHEHNTNLFEILYNRYSGKVSDKCNSLLKDPLLAQEFVQDIFCRVFERLADFRGESNFSTWLYAITYNNCIEYLRTKKKMNYPDWNVSHEMPDIIDELNEKEISSDRLMKILEVIHPEEKALLTMHYIDNMPITYIQTALKISESAAKMRLKRARDRVAFLYKEQFKATG
jgi:RNA polymerase sigma factor (sigma-70 family)